MENIGKNRIQVRNEKGTVYSYNLLSEQPTLAVHLCMAKAHIVVHFLRILIPTGSACKLTGNLVSPTYAIPLTFCIGDIYLSEVINMQILSSDTLA